MKNNFIIVSVSKQDQEDKKFNLQQLLLQVKKEKYANVCIDENDGEKGDEFRKKRKFSEIENKKKNDEDESEDGNKKSRFESYEDLEENKESEKEMEFEYDEVGFDGLQDELARLKECVDEYSKNEQERRGNRKKQDNIEE
ncbi:MAG: hypothetical protein EZS28_019733 [Streblomastix strix]|uniref:Uncharacterized protein n=1 Tax=Streblomastix strix TaxID=222440 RepID=A0A5J4VQ64_9EUKA|nr:MAG: hypothetical protein EZS28_019733 [Streblomastix strix]